MKKVTKKVCTAFIEGRSLTMGNTKSLNGLQLTLFDNCIARRNGVGGYVLDMCGYPTVTTRERLNGLCELLGFGRPFTQRKGTQYYLDTAIDAGSTIITLTPDQKAALVEVSYIDPSKNREYCNA